MENEVPGTGIKSRRTWPWIVAVVLGLGLALAVAWVRTEARRIHEQRQTEWSPAAGSFR